MYSSAFDTVRAVRWTRAQGTIDLGTLGTQGSRLSTLSTDGSVVFGFSTPAGSSIQKAFRWTSSAGMDGYAEPWGGTSLYSSDRKSTLIVDRHAGAVDVFDRYDGTSLVQSGPVAGNHQLSLNVLAGNGVTAFGQYTNGTTVHAVRWDGAANSTPLDMGTLGGLSSEVTFSSTNGDIAFGHSNRSDGSIQAFRWTTNGGMQSIVPNSYSESGFGYINSSATEGIGSINSSTGSRTFRWTESAGFQDLGSLGGGSFRYDKISANGSVIVGNSSLTTFGKPLATRWTESTGLVDIGFTNMNSILYSGGSEDLSVLLYRTTNTSGLQQLYRVTGNNVLTDMGKKDGSILSVFDVSKDASKMLLASSSKMYYWNDSIGFRDMGIVKGVQIDQTSGHLTMSPTFDLISGTVRVDAIDHAWIWSLDYGSLDLRQLLITNGADLTNWDSLNQVDLIENVNGVAYVTGLGTYKGVNGFKFYAAVPEPSIVIGIAAGTLMLIRRRRKSIRAGN